MNLENPLLTPIFDHIKNTVDYTHVAVFYLESTDVTLIGYRGPKPYAQAAMINFDLAESSILHQANEDCAPVLMSDALGDTPLAQKHQRDMEIVPGQPFYYPKSWMRFPLSISEQFSIILDVSHCERNHYIEKDILPLQQYIESVASIIEKVVLSSVLTQRYTKYQALSTIQQAIFRHLEISDVLQLIADQSRQLVSAQNVTLYLINGTTISANFESRETTSTFQAGNMQPLPDSLIGETIRTKRPLRMRGYPDNPNKHSDEGFLFGSQPFLIIPLLIQDRPIGAIVAIGRDFGFFGSDDERMLNMLATGAAIALENARLYQDEQEKRRVAESMQNILFQLSSSLPLNEILNAILIYTIQLLEAGAGLIYCNQPGNNEMALTASSGLNEDLLKILRSPISMQSFKRMSTQDADIHGLFTHGADEDADSYPERLPSNNTTHSDSSIYISDWENKGSAPQSTEKKQTDCDPSIVEIFKISVRVHLDFDDETSGLFDIFWREPKSITPDTLQFTETISRSVKLAIERDRLSQKSEELSRLQERQRIAQALHDSVAQTLFRIGLEAKWCYQNFEIDPVGREHIQTIQHLVGRSNHELRSAIFALRNHDLGGNHSYLDLLRDLVKEYQNESGIETTLIVSPNPVPLPSSIAEAIYRILQEALINTRKHANASAILVSLLYDIHTVTVTIQDNGSGMAQDPFLVSEKNNLHFGLKSLRQLVVSLGGNLFIGNNDEHGLIIKASFPLSSMETYEPNQRLTR